MIQETRFLAKLVHLNIVKSDRLHTKHILHGRTLLGSQFECVPSLGSLLAGDLVARFLRGVYLLLKGHIWTHVWCAWDLIGSLFNSLPDDCLLFEFRPGRQVRVYHVLNL